MARSADNIETPTPVILGAGQALNPPLEEADGVTLEQLGASGEEWTRPHSNLWADAFRRLIRNRLALIGLIILLTATFFVPLRIEHPFWMLLFLVLTAVMLFASLSKNAAGLVSPFAIRASSRS